MNRPAPILQQELTAAIDEAEAARADEAAAQAAEQARQVGTGCKVARGCTRQQLHASGHSPCTRDSRWTAICACPLRSACCLLLPASCCAACCCCLCCTPTHPHLAGHLLQAEAGRARDYIAAHQAELLKAFGKAMEREQARGPAAVASGRRAGAAQAARRSAFELRLWPFALSLTQALPCSIRACRCAPHAPVPDAGGHRSGAGEPGGLGCGAAARARTDSGAAGGTGGPRRR